MEHQSPDMKGVDDALFSFADSSVWPDSRLDARQIELMESSTIPHSEVRRARVARELSHISFERGYRTTGKIAA